MTKYQRNRPITILLTNDDGIHADGIYKLYQALSSIAQVTVIAPESERSSIAHAITLAQPIRVKKIQWRRSHYAYSVSGTPADCVKFGLSQVFSKKKPDLVISGINCGDNDGCSVFYSGTVAAAREGALSAIPSMAISLATFDHPNFNYAAKIGTKIAKIVVRNKLASGTFLNINVPARKSTQIKGILMTRQGQVPIHGEFHKRKDLHAKDYYWMSGKLPSQLQDIKFDTCALKADYVTVTPIHCDSTDYAALKTMQTWSF